MKLNLGSTKSQPNKIKNESFNKIKSKNNNKKIRTRFDRNKIKY